MNNETPYEITDLNLAADGHNRIEWARANMPILRSIREVFSNSRPFENLKISICLHIEAKTAVWLDALQAGGASIAITGSPGSTQDDVAAALIKDYGVHVFGHRDETFDDHLAYCKRILELSPDLIADNGGDLHAFLRKGEPFAELSDKIIGATEETTTGGRRIREMSSLLPFPTFVINDTAAKRIVENRFGVGSSVVDGLMRATNIMLHGKTILVVGYGYCGSGIAQRLRGMGAHVLVAEREPIRQLEAHLEGFVTKPLDVAVTGADIIIAATGYEGVLNASHFDQMKDGALIANAGHFASEIDLSALNEKSTNIEKLNDHVIRYSMSSGKSLFLLGEGNLINLAAGDGNPIEIMDLGLALQSLSLARLAVSANDYLSGAQCVPEDIEQQVVSEALKHWVG